MRLFAKILFVVAVVGALGFGAFQLNQLVGSQSGEAGSASTYTVQRRTVEDRAVERGTIESQNTVHGRCELTGWSNKIISIVEEGTSVKKGDVVAELEAEEIDQNIAQKKVELNEARGELAQAQKEVEIQANKGESDVAQAILDWELAELDLEKYREGDSKAELADQERAIKEAEAELERTRDELNSVALLVKKGYRSPEQLREVELREQSLKFRVESETRKLSVLKNFDYKRKMKEFDAKAANLKLAVARAEATATAENLKAEAKVANAQNAVELHENELNELSELKEKCILKAPQDGTVAYANERWFDPEDRIREGTTVRHQQNIFYLPDMEHMQVRVNIHESVVNRIEVGQTASIRLDAFQEFKLVGKVTFVSELAASSYSNSMNYEALVVIDEIPYGLALKPGMTAEVDILVGVYEDIVAVPIGAITEHFQQSYAYVLNGPNKGRTRVKTGRMTHSFVEIVEGLEPGDEVALDAYQRGTEDFSEAEQEVGGGTAPSTPAPATDTVAVGG